MYGMDGHADSALVFHAKYPPNTPNLTIAAPWTNRPDLQPEGLPNPNSGPEEGNFCRRFTLSSQHPGGVLVAMCDGSVQFISENIASDPARQNNLSCFMNAAWPISDLARPGFTLQNLFFRNDGNVIGEF